MPPRFDRLVRDKVPEMIRTAGRECETRIASHEEFEAYAVKKLQEEVEEFAARGSIDDVVDILEMLHRIATFRSIPWEEVEKLRVKKAWERGGYDMGVVLLGSD